MSDKITLSNSVTLKLINVLFHLNSPITNSWAPIVAMTSRRSGVGLAVVNQCLYACGGFDGELSELDKID